MRNFKLSWEISIKINFKLNKIHDVADETVAEQVDAENIASQSHNNNVHIMNKGEWTNEEKLKIVQIYSEERQKGKNFMKRIKQRRVIEFPQKKRTVQNLVDNARRFEKESLEPGVGVNIQAQNNINWTTEMKIKLVKIDDEERSKGRGFMKRVQERWDLKFLEQASFNMHNLRNNASRFQKELEIRNLILVRNRNEIDRQKDRVYEDPSSHQVAFEHDDERDSIQNDRVQEANSLINENDNEQELRTVIRVEDKELENIFNQILQDMEHTVSSKSKAAKI